MEYDDYLRTLNCFKKQQTISLNELASTLGIDKNELDKKLTILIKNGYPFRNLKSDLISLHTSPDLYDKNLIVSQLSSEEVSLEIILLTLVDSTNTHLKSSLYANDSLSICIAEKQTDGRGRRGKTWYSPFGSSITFSIRKKLVIDPQISGCLSLVTGLSLISALQKLGYSGLNIKWPNDIYVNHKKLAGILIETVAIKRDYIDIIIGVGINLDIPNSCSSNIDQPWINLSEIGTSSNQNRSILIASIIKELLVNLKAFQKTGLNSFLPQWKAHDYLYGRSIYVKQESIQTKGIAKGINHIGELLMQRENTLLSINAGEVSVRLTDNQIE